MLSFLKKIFGSKQDKDVEAYMPLVQKVLDAHKSIELLSNDELRNKTLEFKEIIANYLSNIDADIQKITNDAIEEENIHKKEALFKELDALDKERNEHLEVVLKQILPEAFAVVKETAKRFSENQEIPVKTTDYDRDLVAKGKKYLQIDGDSTVWQNSWTAAGGEITWNMVHYDVQLLGGMVLHDGKIAEMATGEGKTLVSTLPSYLNALSGRGVHIVTVNDYLAKRDSEWNGPIFEFLLLTVDCIDKHRPNSEERRQAYLCDITYGTNNEFGFDYLRDNMVGSIDEVVQRKHHYAMVDEVDSVLIDDARTPLIISGPITGDAEDQDYQMLKPLVERLVAEQRKLATEYLAEAKKLVNDNILGYNEGEAGLALLRSHRALPKNRPLIKFLSEEGVKVMLQKAENHYMQEQSKNMHKVDATLLFTIDEKNRNVELTEKGAEYLSKGNEDNSMFILPNIAEKMIDIDKSDLTLEEKEASKRKVSQEFSVKSKMLHAVSQLLKAYTLFEKDEEYVVMEGNVKIVDEQTGRIMEGRRYSDGLHQAIEAKENVKVGEITQTYATVTLQNFFRMYHKLAGMTGTAETEAHEFWEIYKLDVVTVPTNRNIVRKDLEDVVYKTAREKYNAVIDEIVRLSQAGRPVLVGTTSVDISEKLSRMLQLRGIKHNVLNAKQHQREAEVVAEAGIAGHVTIATNMAGRGTDIKLGAGVKEAGGLAIIGTERHDSRRVDRQLRGRAGRQGDPGTSQFFVSLEDALMRLFNSDRIAGLMDKMGHKDGEMIQHSMVTKSIERAQKKVEENNFGIRKRLLEYDDVMNIQREAIYKKRNNALQGDRLNIDINQMFMGLTANLVDDYRHYSDWEGFRIASISKLGIDPDMDKDFFLSKDANSVIDKYQQQVFEVYDHKNAKIIEVLFPIAKNVFENEGHKYRRLSIPFTDGSTHILPIAAELNDAVKTNGKSIIKDIEKTVTLSLIDEAWKEHLRDMDDLKESVQSASFEQKDPLVIYKMSAYKYFETLVYNINEKVTAYLSKGMLAFEPQDSSELPPPPPVRKQQPQRNLSQNINQQSSQESGQQGNQQAKKQSQVINSQAIIGRNDACPCGSGKKFKQCHGK